jgi:hypothetical protein
VIQPDECDGLDAVLGRLEQAVEALTVQMAASVAAVRELAAEVRAVR